MIKFNNITKKFKTDFYAQPFVALDDVSFSVPEGSMVGFLGANGAGKTTSLKVIMDFIRPTSGEVEFSSTLGRDKFEAYKNIGFLPERPYFYPNLTGDEFLEFMGTLSEVPKNIIKDRVKFWSPRFKIDHALKRELKTYSKGMLQRIGFLATILHEPKMIILDEPLSGLDPIGRKELKDVIVEVHKEGKTVFFSSHIVPDIEEICDRVIFLKEGKLVYDGSVQALIGQNTNPNYEVKFIAPSVVDIKTNLKILNEFSEGLKVAQVSSSDRNQLLRELLEKNIEVVGIDLIRPSLEEIFYQTRQS
jgi:ABC-2 type transport system ATP-binding protein